MNETLKRLIQVLNDAGYEVIKIQDKFNDPIGGNLSGYFSIDVKDCAKEMKTNVSMDGVSESF